jgi:hypothetical protein
VVGGIYSPNHQTNRWGWAAVDGRTGQSGAPLDTVRCASHVTQPLRFDRWSSDSLGHRTVTGHCSLSGAPSGAALTSARTVRTLWRFSGFRWSQPLHCSRCSTGTPDSPVNYSRVARRKPKAKEFRVDLPRAPDTDRWCTGHCPVAHQTVRCDRPGQPSVSFAPFFLNPDLDHFYGLC